MRNYNDNQIVSTTGVDLNQMMGLGAAPLPPPAIGQQPAVVPRPRQRPVEVEILRDGRTTESISFVRTSDGGSMQASVSRASGAPPQASAPPTSSGPAGSPPEGGGADLPDLNSTPPDLSSGTSPLGLLSAPPAPPAAIVPGVAGADAAASDAKQEPAAPDAAGTSGFATAPSGFDGPKSHTIDVP
jgi:hypothetical protein